MNFKFEHIYQNYWPIGLFTFVVVEKGVLTFWLCVSVREIGGRKDIGKREQTDIALVLDLNLYFLMTIKLTPQVTLSKNNFIVLIPDHIWSPENIAHWESHWNNSEDGILRCVYLMLQIHKKSKDLPRKLILKLLVQLPKTQIKWPLIVQTFGLSDLFNF